MNFYPVESFIQSVGFTLKCVHEMIITCKEYLLLYDTFIVFYFVQGTKIGTNTLNKLLAQVYYYFFICPMPV